eukprot:15343591-Ditylum_brightwellii.AAC.1
MSLGLVHHLYYGICGGDVIWDEEYGTVLGVLLFWWRRRKFYHVRQLKPATVDPNMPQHVRDAKTVFYNMHLKADCCTGVSSDKEAREYLLKNGFASVPEE